MCHEDPGTNFTCIKGMQRSSVLDFPSPLYYYVLSVINVLILTIYTHTHTHTYIYIYILIDR